MSDATVERLLQTIAVLIRWQTKKNHNLYSLDGSVEPHKVYIGKIPEQQEIFFDAPDTLLSPATFIFVTKSFCMKVHTTNYTNTFIEIAADCPAKSGEIPPVKGKPSVANMQFEMVYENPYKYSSDDVLFEVYADRNEIPKSERKHAREVFFSKGQPCFRASPLTKRYGWGVHNDAGGKIAIYGCETKAYKTLTGDKKIKVVKAMKTSK